MSRVLVVGSYNRDLNFAMDRMPVAGETVLGARLIEGPGGKGSNQAFQAALAGAEVAMFAALGDDAAGREAVERWRRAGIDTGIVVAKRGVATGSAAILVERGGENRIVVASGANAALSPADLRRAARAVDGARVVVGQLEIPMATTKAAFGRARKAGATTILNTAPVTSPLPSGFLAPVDIVIANEIEARALTGLSARSRPDALAPALARYALRAAIVTAGARGAWLSTTDGAHLHIPAFRTKVVDTTGAGDAFVGAFAARLAVGADIAEAVRWGTAAGSLACRSRGAAASYADRRAIAALVGR